MSKKPPPKSMNFTAWFKAVRVQLPLVHGGQEYPCLPGAPPQAGVNIYGKGWVTVPLVKSAAGVQQACRELLPLCGAEITFTEWALPIRAVLPVNGFLWTKPQGLRPATVRVHKAGRSYYTLDYVPTKQGSADALAQLKQMMETERAD